MAKPSEKISPSEFVSKIVTDPKTHVEVLLLQGFVGPSSEEGHTRLYFDAQLSNYVEIPDDAILHTKEVASQQSPLGGTYVWIKRDAQVVHGRAGGSRTKAGFLEGAIMGGGLPGFPGGGWPTPPPPTPIPLCGGFTPAHGCPLTPIHGCPPPPSPLPVLCGHTPLIPCHPPSPIPGVCGHTPVIPCHTPPPPSPIPVLCGQTPLQPCVPHTAVGPCTVPCTIPALCHLTPLCPQTSVKPCITLPAICTAPVLCNFTPHCPVTPHCPATPLCPVVTPACPQVTAPQQGCVISAVHVCQTFGACPSAVDACPSAPGGCGFQPNSAACGFPGGLPGINQ